MQGTMTMPPQGMMQNMLMPPQMMGLLPPTSFSQGGMMMHGPSPPTNMQMPMGMMMMPPQGLFPPGLPPNMNMMMMPQQHQGFQPPIPSFGAAARQGKQPSSSSSSANTSFESTGSDSADADIQAFYKAKQLLAGAMGVAHPPPHTR
jgi:hypothetical protein